MNLETGMIMAMADVKASLAGAYAAGERPTFVSVLPSGYDEIWKMHGVMLVVPIVPPDAPTALQFALRLRRDALISGICENCEATFAIKIEAEVLDVPLAGLFFPHRITCPGNDASTKKMLQGYRQAKHDEKFDLASAAASERLREDAGSNGVELDAAEFGDRIEQRIAELLSPPVPVCEHLESDPDQVWSTFIAHADWKCDACWEQERQEVLRTGTKFDAIEEFTCDLCRRYAPKSIAKLVIRHGIFLLRGGACARCQAHEASQRAIDATVSGGN
ncbi:hypothetical protein [Kineosporia sp. NBRC 101731]|uniref:hypothetical protein n=1 Tax=Kineosporia sp. NBRC 101731 TaxID=3032199 RepID=UPI0024A24989|nr:hypothetical protein [Kineosporia sp. NBRC 101731]GLY27420.1 hypothetical protein Kisp02_07850 [Kineosporia sp. NBRC 101731]